MNEEFLLTAIKKGKSLGAEHIDIIADESCTCSVTSRIGKIEQVTNSNLEYITIRTTVGKRQAISVTNSSEDLLKDDFIEQLVVAAKNSPEDAYISQPEKDSAPFEQLQICDYCEVNTEDLAKYAVECEQLVLNTPGITNSEGSSFFYEKSTHVLVKDYDFLGKYDNSSFLVSTVPLAEKNGELQQSYAYQQVAFFDQLKSPKDLAEEATSRTLKKIGSRKIKSCVVPVIFERRCAQNLLGSVIQAINGANVANNMSFLKDKIHKKIMTDAITVYDDYKKGIASRPFDSDGLCSQNNELIVDGVLKTFLLNSRYANQLGMKSTHNAFGFSAVAPNYVYIENGNTSLNELIGNIRQGILITETMGDGLNLVSGNYSTGVCGFWIENGEVQYPVNEITIAGDFDTIFSDCIPASDLTTEKVFADSPSLFIPQMTIGGE